MMETADPWEAGGAVGGATEGVGCAEVIEKGIAD